jgi:hypothetical protein
MIWVLLHLDELEAGKWVSPPDDSSNSNVNPEAAFVKAVTIAAETRYRLKCCGIYGKFLLSQVREMGKDEGIEGWQIKDRLDPDALAALIFISGWSRKTMAFWAWRKQRRYRKNLTQTSQN